MIILVPRAFSLPRSPRKECMRNFWNGLKMCKNVLKLFLKLNLLVWSCVSVEFRGDFAECSGQPVVWVPRRLNWRNDLKLIWKLCCHVKDAKCKLSLIQSRFCMTTVDLAFAIYSSGQHTGPSWTQASFWLSGLSVHLCIAMQFNSKFIWVKNNHFVLRHWYWNGTALGGTLYARITGTQLSQKWPFGHRLK